MQRRGSAASDFEGVGACGRPAASGRERGLKKATPAQGRERTSRYKRLPEKMKVFHTRNAGKLFQDGGTKNC